MFKLLSTAALNRIYRKAYKQLGCEGRTFGFDWRTISITHPYWAKVLRGAYDELSVRRGYVACSI